jgi:hypothetical protein
MIATVRPRLLLLPLLIVTALVLPASAAADPNSDAVNAVKAFDPQNEATQRRLNEVVRRGGVNLQVLKPQLSKPNLNRRWAATYLIQALARSLPDHRLLEKPLRDRDESVQALAGFGLIGFGEEQSIPVLISALRSRQYLRNSEPPELLAALADERLVHFTKADFRFDPYASSRARRRAIRKWNEWWSEVKDNIRWDRQGKRYRWRRERSRRPASTHGGPGAQTAESTLGGFDGGTATIAVKLQFAGRPLPNQLAKRVAAAEKLLEGSRAASRTGMCFNVDFNFDVQVTDIDAPRIDGRHYVNVASVDADDYLTSHADIPPPGQSGQAEFDTADDSVTLAHEILHLAGLPDEYEDDGKGKTTPNDEASIMAAPRGRLLQRHLDFLASRFLDSQQEALCEKYHLEFSPWESQSFAQTVGAASAGAQAEAAHQQPGDHSHVIGEFASAVVAADFWLNTLNNRVTPAGHTPCGSLLVTNPCPGEVRGSSSAGAAQADKGQATCQSVQLKWTAPRFPTAVAGERQSGSFNLQLAVSDSQRFRYRCNPPASPSSGILHMIRDGMEFAGALAFTIPVPAMGSESSKSFSFSDSSARAEGTVHITRLR